VGGGDREPDGFVPRHNAEPSVSAGVISATGRNLAGREAAGVSVDMIQTDARSTPRQLGRAARQRAGEVVGVNSSIYTPSGGSVGLGFAIPINRAAARRRGPARARRGAARRGLSDAAPHAERAEPARAPAAGVVVRAVVPGSPAARAGVAPGDVLRRRRHARAPQPSRLGGRAARPAAGEAVPLVVRAGGGERTRRARRRPPEVTRPR
jgi:S1-C subfamily serine protease